MDAIDVARGMFPLMPNVVFDTWLAPLIALEGWPFGIEESVPVGNWTRYLVERPVAKWATFTWRLTCLNHVHERLSNGSRADVMQVMMNAMDLAPGAGFGVRDSKERVIGAREKIFQLKDFPGFVIAFADSHGKLHIVDGHHRLAAWCGISGTKRLDIPFWIAVDPL